MASNQAQRMRTRLAQEAARIIMEEGVKDYQLAKRKAVDRLGVNQHSALPRNTEIELALREYQNIYFTDDDRQHLQALRKTALQAMQQLANFDPQLSGAVLEGIANKHSDIELHVYADSTKDVIFSLMEADIPFESAERRLRYGGDAEYFPALRFLANNTRIEVVILPTLALRRAPLSPLNGKPMKRAGIAELEDLLRTTATNVI